MTNVETVLDNVEHMVHDPHDGTYTLEDYMILTRRDPTKATYVNVPVLGRIPVVEAEPPLSGAVDVKATLVNYWIEKGLRTNILHAEFMGDLDLGTVRRFSRPFNQSHRSDLSKKELSILFEETFEDLKYHEVIFSARRTKTGDSIEGIQTPDGQSWILL